jgi:hypothetical protein
MRITFSEQHMLARQASTAAQERTGTCEAGVGRQVALQDADTRRLMGKYAVRSPPRRLHAPPRAIFTPPAPSSRSPRARLIARICPDLPLADAARGRLEAYPTGCTGRARACMKSSPPRRQAALQLETRVGPPGPPGPEGPPGEPPPRYPFLFSSPAMMCFSIRQHARFNLSHASLTRSRSPALRSPVLSVGTIDTPSAWFSQRQVQHRVRVRDQPAACPRGANRQSTGCQQSSKTRGT